MQHIFCSSKRLMVDTQHLPFAVDLNNNAIAHYSPPKIFCIRGGKGAVRVKMFLFPLNMRTFQKVCERFLMFVRHAPQLLACGNRFKLPVNAKLVLAVKAAIAYKAREVNRNMNVTNAGPRKRCAFQTVLAPPLG